MSADWQIISDDLRGPEIRALLQQHFAAMLANSPAGSCHFLDFDGLTADGVNFWSIWISGELAGCGALKRIGPDHGEIKSMRVADAFRGRGAGYAMLQHIAAEARARGLSTLSLETGSGPAFADAANLYRRAGFRECPPFADYRPDPFSKFMTITL